MSVVIFLLFAIQANAETETFQTDIEAIQDIEYFLNELNLNALTTPKVNCTPERKIKSKRKINTPFCSYQDICSVATREEGFLSVNGVKVPDFQLHTKLTQLKNNILNCYDQLDDETETYKDLFSVNGHNSLIHDLIAPNRIQKFRKIYNRVDYRAQLPKFFEHSISSTDLDTYLKTNHEIDVKDYNGRYMALDDYSLNNLVALNNYLAAPGNEDKKNILKSKLYSEIGKRRLDEFFFYNNGTQRQKLLLELEEKMNLRGFDYVDSVLFNKIKFSQEVYDKETLVINKMKNVKALMIAKLKKLEMNEEQRQYFTSKITQAKLVFKNPIEDGACTGGTPMYANGTDVVICPKALDIPAEALSATIGKELAHLIDHCSSHFYAVENQSLFGPNAPKLSESPFKEINKCIKKN